MERYRNLIETNIAAGITLYTDHKPGLYENSLSNKGQLSAWRLLETADLLSIVENLYRTGGKMLLADPLSRLCAPGDGFYDVSLPGKINVLLQNLPQQVAECAAMNEGVGKQGHCGSGALGAEVEEAHESYQSRKIGIVSGT